MRPLTMRFLNHPLQLIHSTRQLRASFLAIGVCLVLGYPAAAAPRQDAIVNPL
jgi:ABC-type spermidine/putrescine transport system permease subunit I